MWYIKYREKSSSKAIRKEKLELDLIPTSQFCTIKWTRT